MKKSTFIIIALCLMTITAIFATSCTQADACEASNNKQHNALVYSKTTSERISNANGYYITRVINRKYTYDSTVIIRIDNEETIMYKVHFDKDTCK